VRLWNPRDHAEGNYRRVDDRPFGGGPGMVMMAQPLLRAVQAVRASRAQNGKHDAKVPLVMFTPTGRPLTQALVEEFGGGPGALLLCGRYEGVDQRFVDREVDIEVSLGDFVLSGGELPALVLLDAVARLQPGVLNDARSHLQDSFSDGLLDCPHYSRPEVLHTAHGPCPIPSVLMSGHHADIARWRRDRSLELTAARRPDLIEAARSAGRLSKADEKVLRTLSRPAP
jgi:tRNA (guanine37-N1)-methyltransferase